MYRVSSKASTIAGYDLEGVIHGLPYTGHADPLAVSFFPEKPHAADGLDFPDGGWRAWSVAIGVSVLHGLFSFCLLTDEHIVSVHDLCHVSRLLI